MLSPATKLGCCHVVYTVSLYDRVALELEYAGTSPATKLGCCHHVVYTSSLYDRVAVKIEYAGTRTQEHLILLYLDAIQGDRGGWPHSELHRLIRRS